jgi:hypothetical protein
MTECLSNEHNLKVLHCTSIAGDGLRIPQSRNERRYEHMQLQKTDSAAGQAA